MELKSIFNSPNHVVPPSEVRNEWANFLEVAMEPAGWQAIWQIGRSLCDTLNLRYPTEVMGTVEQVFLKEQTAMFLIEAVQDDIELPEKFEVPLDELWPLKSQENQALCIEMTAKALDQYRFFYNHLWMPWDQDSEDGVDWASKHLESRMKLHLALITNKMNPALVSYVRHLLTEARYIQSKKEELEAELEDDEHE